MIKVLLLGIFIGATIGYITAALMAAPNYSEIPTSSTAKDNLAVEEGPEINEALDKIRAEIEQAAFKDVNCSKYIFVNRVNQIIDKYKNGDEK